MLAGSFGAVSGLIRMSSFLLVQRGDLSQNAQTELASNIQTDVDREQAGGWGVGVGKGAGEGIEQNRKKKEKDLLDTDNSVVNAGGTEWVEAEEGIGRIPGEEKIKLKNK